MSRAARSLESVARPKQARSEETLYRLLDAAETLIEEKGLGDASIPEIVRRAGSSVGGFYARFQDKDALLRALEERFFEQVSARLEALADERRWADARLPEIVDACAAELVAVAGRHRNLIAAFLIRSAHDPAVREGGLRFRRRVAERITRLLVARGDEIAHPEPALAIDLGVQFAFGLMLQRAVTGEIRAAGRSLTDGELRREIARNFLAYLERPDPRRRP
jgi:AcrR family transcriptional regulator